MTRKQLKLQVFRSNDEQLELADACPHDNCTKILEFISRTSWFDMCLFLHGFSCAFRSLSLSKSHQRCVRTKTLNALTPLTSLLLLVSSSLERADHDPVHMD